MPDIQPTANVPVKSAWASKINWIAGIGGGLTVAAALCSQVAPAAALIPAPYGAYVTAGCAAITGVAIWWTRTFKTTSITPQSAAKI